MFQSLSESAQRILQKAFPDAKNIRVSWQSPREMDHGDAATTIALQLAKQLKKNPKEIAEVLAAGLSKEKGIERAEVAGAGYVNVWLTPEALLKELNRTREAQTPKVTRKNDRPVIVEYSQPNIAKPLGIHHILSTVIGQSLSNLYRHLGYNTIAINHLGDWGTQFGKLAVAMQKWGKGKRATDLGMDGLLKLYVKFHEEAEKDATLEDQGREAFRKLEEGDADMRRFWQEVLDTTMQSLGILYKRLHVPFDEVQGESFYEDKMAPIIEEGTQKKVFEKGEEGALVVQFPREGAPSGPEESKLPTYMVLKSDGATLYSTRDLATIRYRVDRWHPEAILYVVDMAQQLYFQQLFATVKKLGWDVPHLEHVIFGRMRFADKKMSTRKGNILKLEEVLDEAVRRADEVITEHGGIQTDDPKELAEMMGIGALVYGILNQNRRMDMVFDWGKMLSFEGNSAPYLQYTHARARSVLRKAGEEGSDIPASITSLTASERLLIRTLLLLPEVLEEARSTHMPHTLANYLYQLCKDFNAFYNAEPILKSEGGTRQLRLALTRLTADVLKSGAEILTLRVPERM